MSISKISRTLVVILFLALIIFMGYQDVMLLLNNNSSSPTLNILKVVYIIVTALLVALYVYIKDKLYRKKVKRNISLIYRYVYITFIVVIMSIISIYKYLYLIENTILFMYIFLKLFIGFVLKKIIFNVSKSDILSVLGLFGFAMLPCVYTDVNMIFINLIKTLIIFSTMLLIQKLIDELKQLGIKNKKYLVISGVLGIFVGVSITIGISVYLWIIMALMSLILTVNLDKTHLGFPKKIISIVNSKTKDTLYKVERINISKLIVSIITIALIASLITFIGMIVINNTSIDKIGIFNLSTGIKDINVENFVSNLLNNTNILNSTSKTYYVLLYSYIVFIEILAFVLRRRYDTKSTVMKLFFILLYICISVFGLDITHYQMILTVFLILISIVNTSNIYLNREERVKMLVAS